MFCLCSNFGFYWFNVYFNLTRSCDIKSFDCIYWIFCFISLVAFGPCLWIYRYIYISLFLYYYIFLFFSSNSKSFFYFCSLYFYIICFNLCISLYCSFVTTSIFLWYICSSFVNIRPDRSLSPDSLSFAFYSILKLALICLSCAANVSFFRFLSNTPTVFVTVSVFHGLFSCC